MRNWVTGLAVGALLAWPVTAQERTERDAATAEVKKERERPPRIPDGPFVPKRGMVKREKGQFWAGPPDESRFSQILALTLVPKEKLQEKLAEWPGYQALSPEQKSRLAERIDQVRATARRQALDVAREFNLTVGEGQEEEFVRMYWAERIRMEDSLRRELLTKRKKMEKESQERIYKSFPQSVKN